MDYFVTMIDYGKRGREAIVDPEETRRDIISNIVRGEYRGPILFVHHIGPDNIREDVTEEILREATILMADAAE